MTGDWIGNIQGPFVYEGFHCTDPEGVREWMLEQLNEIWGLEEDAASGAEIQSLIHGWTADCSFPSVTDEMGNTYSIYLDEED